MYEYTTLPNSWEAENLTWEHYYAESYLGVGGHISQADHEVMVLSMERFITIAKIETEIDAVRLPKDVYDVYLQHHFEGRDLPCQQSI